MKNMQNFHNWLAIDETLLPDQHRFNGLTRISKVRLVKVSNQTPWYIWHDEKTAQTEKSPVGS